MWREDLKPELTAFRAHGLICWSMTEDIEKLITSLRLGHFEDPAERIGLLAAALLEQNADLSLLLSLMRAPQVPLRLAAIQASRDRTEPELLSELLLLVKNPEIRVRLALVEVLGPRREQGAAEALKVLVNDADYGVRVAVLRATTGREDLRTAQEKCLLTDSDWTVRSAALNALEVQKSLVVVKTLVLSLEQDDDPDITKRCAEVIERRLQESPAATRKQLPHEIGRISRIDARLKAFCASRFPHSGLGCISDRDEGGSRGALKVWNRSDHTSDNGRPAARASD